MTTAPMPSASVSCRCTFATRERESARTGQPLSLEEVSKLWAAFQTNYRLSAAYQVAVILIESTRAARTPLPVLSQGKDDRGPTAQGDLIPPFPAIDRIAMPVNRDIAQLNDQLTLAGHHFALTTGDPAQVMLAESGANPAAVARHH